MLIMGDSDEGEEDEMEMEMRMGMKMKARVMSLGAGMRDDGCQQCPDFPLLGGRGK